MNGRRHMEKRLLDPLTERPWMNALTGEDITYVQQANKVVIPPHWLNPPYFHYNYPASVNHLVKQFAIYTTYFVIYATCYI